MSENKNVRRHRGSLILSAGAGIWGRVVLFKKTFLSPFASCGCYVRELRRNCQRFSNNTNQKSTNEEILSTFKIKSENENRQNLGTPSF